MYLVLLLIIAFTFGFIGWIFGSKDSDELTVQALDLAEKAIKQKEDLINELKNNNA